MKTIKCWKYGKWSYHFEKCRWCGTSKKSWNTRHKGHGLCINCFDIQRRDKNPKRKQQLKNQGRKFYDKNKDNPEFKRLAYESVIKSQATPEYKKKLKTHIYERRRFIYFIRNQKKFYKRHNGIEIIIDGERIKTPIQPSRSLDSEKDKTMNKIELFKKVYKKWKTPQHI